MRVIHILALLGKSGAGKDTIQEAILKYYPGFHKIISCTTRPKRDYENDGDHYHFITEEDFANLAYNNQFIEALEFNGWFYGSPLSALNPDKINIGIFTPEGVDCLFESAEEYNLQILPIYIKCEDKIRILRALEREESPDIAEICRRYKTDEEDFAIIDFDYLSVWNDSELTTPKDLARIIVKYCEDFFN